MCASRRSSQQTKSDTLRHYSQRECATLQKNPKLAATRGQDKRVFAREESRFECAREKSGLTFRAQNTAWHDKLVPVEFETANAGRMAGAFFYVSARSDRAHVDLFAFVRQEQVVPLAGSNRLLHVYCYLWGHDTSKASH